MTDAAQHPSPQHPSTVCPTCRLHTPLHLSPPSSSTVFSQSTSPVGHHVHLHKPYRSTWQGIEAATLLPKRDNNCKSTLSPTSATGAQSNWTPSAASSNGQQHQPAFIHIRQRQPSGTQFVKPAKSVTVNPYHGARPATAGNGLHGQQWPAACTLHSQPCMDAFLGST